MKIWFLEGYIGTRDSLQRIRVTQFPFRIGRQTGLSLELDSSGISRLHAEIDQDSGGLTLTDLDSTNGTFVNRQPVNGRQRIRSGDILHFADKEFRLVSEAKTTGHNMMLTQQGILDLPEELPQGSRELQEMLMDNLVTAVFQPIVDRVEHTVHAFEMLGRGRHPALSESPAELFRIAESLDLEVHLSEIFRRVGVDLAQLSEQDCLFFTNIHPHEMRDAERLLASMERIRETYTELPLVLEIHEAAVADRTMLQQVRDRMDRSNIRLAYDDFGRGQARLVELAEVPPDYVKLDMSLMRDIDTAAAAKQQMVRMLTSYAQDMGIKVIAEGICSDGEAKFCDDVKIDLLQGYRYGKPEALVQLDDSLEI
ncbi:MAG: EAL domain-containing protein [Xanthomonadales bacterium]|nr:EAL domain-containing protein [Xanthomonadales bacterium]